MELAKNVRPMVTPYYQLIWSDATDPLEIQFRYRAPPLSYDFIRLLILSIEQFLLLINMPLLIVRMGWYLVCCSPCVGTRRFDDMCKDTAYFCREDSLTSKPRSQGYLMQSDKDTSILVIGQPRKC